MIASLLNLLGGFGILLFGVKTLSEASQALAGDRLRRIIGRGGSDPLHGFRAGLVASAITQSSSVTTVMMVSFVNSGLMTLLQAASVTLGANVGATVIGWLLAFRLQHLALALVGAGALITLFSRREPVKFSGELGLGLGLLFIGLGWLESGFAPLQGDNGLTHFCAALGSANLASLLLTVLVGVAVTVVVPSAGGMIGVTMALGTVGLITFDAAAALVLGENVGTTIVTQRASGLHEAAASRGFTPW
jgi:phosphate:Na+ symporter